MIGNGRKVPQGAAAGASVGGKPRQPSVVAGGRAGSAGTVPRGQGLVTMVGGCVPVGHRRTLQRKSKSTQGKGRILQLKSTKRRMDRHRNLFIGLEVVHRWQEGSSVDQAIKAVSQENNLGM